MSTPKNPLADFAPKLVEITEKVLFGDVWERPQLSKRDRSLITCAALVATGKTEQMSFHFPRAIENGVTEEELTVSLSIARAGTQPSQKGPAEHFTGSVRIDPLFQAKESTQASGAYVTFEPGARSAWHTHPRGQTLIVTAGVGRVQIEGGPIEEIRPGDVVWIPPGKRHWHGASPTTAMTHLAVQEHQGGKVVEWMEKVTDEQYLAAP